MQPFFYREKNVYLLLVLTAVLWGGNAVTAKYVVSELPPITTAFFRFAWVSVVLLAVVWLAEGRKCLPGRDKWPGIIALGITGIFGHNLFVYTGVKYSTATNMSLLATINPVVTACLAAVFLHERLSRRQLGGVGLALIGVIIVVTKGDWQVVTGLRFNIGDILLAMAPMAWAAYSVIGRKVMRGLSPLAATAWASLVGSLLLLAAALAEGFGGKIALSPLGWASMLYMILGSGVVAFYLWNHGVAVIGPSRAAVFSNVIPLAGMFLAAVLLKENIGWQQLTGAALIIGGVWLTTQTGAQRPLPSAQRS